MLDTYLLRLSHRAKPEIRDEIARIRGNFASAASAVDIVTELMSVSFGEPVADGLSRLQYDLVSLRAGCNGSSLQTRRNVCDRVPERRRRRTIVAAMAAIAVSRRACGWQGDWGADALKEALVVSEASVVDPVSFEKVIVRLQALKMSGRPTGTGLKAALAEFPYFMGFVPDYPDPLPVWCSFVMSLQPANVDRAPGSGRSPRTADVRVPVFDGLAEVSRLLDGIVATAADNPRVAKELAKAKSTLSILRAAPPLAIRRGERPAVSMTEGFRLSA